jgi:hypothetical protein
MNEQITRALDKIEGAGSAPTGDLLDTYKSIRPHLHDLVTALNAEGGDLGRVGVVLENLLAGADSLASGAPVGGNTGPSTSDAAKI